MARPSKDYKIQRNGTSIQVFEKGEYLGSFPIARLCVMLRAEKAQAEALHTVGESTQTDYLKNDA